MSQTTVPPSVIGRVRKLLALAAEGSGATEAEAASAATKAGALLAEYNLSLAEIGDATDPEAVRERTEAGVAQHDWQVNLLGALARHNFCAHWTDTRRMTRPGDTSGQVRKRRVNFLIGRRANVVSTTLTQDYLETAARRLCPYVDTRDRSARSWFKGFADRVVERLDAAREAAEAASQEQAEFADRTHPTGDGRSLVLADVYSTEEDLNNDLRWGRPAGTTAARRRENTARERVWIEQYRAEAAERQRVRNRAAELQTALEGAAENERAEIHEEFNTLRAAHPDLFPPEETPAERRAREAKAAKDARRDQRWWENYQQRKQREAARIDQGAYTAGAAAGADVGLDPQVAATRRAAIARG